MSHKHTKQLTFLDRNEYNYAASPLVEKTLQEFNINDLCTYTRCFQQGIKSGLSQYISDLYRVPESNVVIGYGGEDILKAAIHCFLTKENNERKIMIPTFSWWYYKSIAEEVKGKTIMYPLYEDGYDFKYKIPEIKRIAAIEKPDIVLLASPNNPTGNSLTHEEVRDIISGLDKDTVVIMDEAYALFSNRNLAYIPALLTEFPNLLIIRTFSKFFGLPGLRLGYAFMGEALKEFSGFSTMYLGYNKLSEKLGIAALQSMDYYNANADRMQHDKEIYKQELNSLSGFKVYNSHANFVLVKYPVKYKEKLKQAFENENLVVKFMNEEGLQSHMRITLGKTSVNKKVIEIIKKVAEEQ